MVPQAALLWGKGDRHIQCINLRWFLMHPCRACDNSHVWHSPVSQVMSCDALVCDNFWVVVLSDFCYTLMGMLVFSLRIVRVLFSSGLPKGAEEDILHWFGLNPLPCTWTSSAKLIKLKNKDYFLIISWNLLAIHDSQISFFNRISLLVT